RTVRLHRILDCDRPSYLSVDKHRNHGASQPAVFHDLGANGGAVGDHETPADLDSHTVNGGSHAAPWDGPEVLRFGQLAADLLARTLGDRLGDGVLGVNLHRTGNAPQLRLADPDLTGAILDLVCSRREPGLGGRHLAGRDGAGFVQDDGVHAT